MMTYGKPFVARLPILSDDEMIDLARRYAAARADLAAALEDDSEDSFDAYSEAADSSDELLGRFRAAMRARGLAVLIVDDQVFVDASHDANFEAVDGGILRERIDVRPASAVARLA